MTTPRLSIFTGSKNLGIVFREENTITVKYIDFNIPFTSSAGAVKMNLGGKNRIIMLQCVHDGTGFDGVTQEQKLADFIYEMEQWVNDSIASVIVYTDSFGTNYNVAPVNWSWSRGFNDPNRIIYTLLLAGAVNFA